MNIDQLANVGEVVGAVAVVVSLVFLAMEIRRNTKTMRASAAFDSEQTYASLNENIFTDEKVSLLVIRAHDLDATPEDFSESEWAQLYFFFRSCMQITQAQWFLRKEGLLPEDIWEMRSKWATGWIQLPVLSVIWKQDCEKQVFLESFIDEIENSSASNQGLSIPKTRPENVT